VTDANKTKLVRFIESVWNAGDIESVESFIAGTYTIHHDPGDPWHQQTLSIEQFKERVRTSRAPFPDQKFSIQNLLSEGDLVSITWLWNGTHKQAIAGFDASDRIIEMSGATLYFFDRGQISGHWQISDRLRVYQQLLSNQRAADT